MPDTLGAIGILLVGTIFTFAVAGLMAVLAWTAAQFLLATARDRLRESEIAGIRHEEKMVAMTQILEKVKSGELTSPQILPPDRETERERERERSRRSSLYY